MVGRKCLAMRFFRMEVMIVAKTKWPFGGFFLKLLDEKEGTHRYEDYQKELAEAPVTEEAEKEHRESMQAVNAELERLDAEAVSYTHLQMPPRHSFFIKSSGRCSGTLTMAL